MNVSRDGTNAHPLGRPASIKSHYPSTNLHSHLHSTSPNNQPNDIHTIETTNSSSDNKNDGHSHTETHDTNHVSSCISYVNAGSWHSHMNNNNISSWNHNHSDCDNNNTHPSSHSPSSSLSLNNNHNNNNNHSTNHHHHSSNTHNMTSNTHSMTSSNTIDQNHSSSNRAESIHDLPSLITQDKLNQTISPILHSPPTTASSIMSAYNSPSYFVSPSSTGNNVYNHHTPTNHGTAHQSNPTDHYPYGLSPSLAGSSRHSLMARPKLTTTLWEDENTACYQVDANGICVARRQDNDMINGTKLLNVAGMSRGKRDGILKNEKGRVVVKVGAMHLKGVWITFARAKLLAAQYKIQDTLYPLFVDVPSMYLFGSHGHNPMSHNRINGLNGYRQQPSYAYNNSNTWDGHSTDTSHTNISPPTNYKNTGYSSMANHSLNSNDDMFILSSQVDYNRSSISGIVNYSNNNGTSSINSSYSVYPQQSQPSQQQPSQQQPSQQRSNRIYFNEELLDDNRSEIKPESLNEPSSYYVSPLVQKSVLSNNAETIADKSISNLHSSAFHLPSSRGYDSPSEQSSRRQSLSTNRMYTSRHHPYMSPGKMYSSSSMSTLQTYRPSSTDYTNKSPEDNNGSH
ncbi:hypothetical protein BDB01DRAFT_849577 [Pilobolus umbonatus]|nr:hypothetical protein BDB01DRAFT_849577 [Pilobolus umbonatus]